MMSSHTGGYNQMGYNQLGIGGNSHQTNPMQASGFRGVYGVIGKFSTL